MNASQINSAIMQSVWTNDELTSMVDAVKFARARLTQSRRRELSLGDNVSFVNRDGRTVTGFVEKIAIKYVTVKTINGRWKVPASMLMIRIAEDFAA